MRKLFLALIATLAVTGTASAMTTHTIVNGDTLWALAVKYYGDGTLYTILAEVNNISNPRTIRSGTVIKIPDKTDLEEIRDESDDTNRQNMVEQISGASASSSENATEEITDRDVNFVNRLNKKIEKTSFKTTNLSASED